MREMLLHIYMLPLLLAAIFSLRSFRPNWQPHFRVFSIFLFFVLAIEIFEILWKYELHQTAYWSYSDSNTWIYHVSFPFQYILLFLFFRSVEVRYRFNCYSKYLFPPLILLSICNPLFIQGMHKLNTYTLIAEVIVFLVATIRFFRQYRDVNEALHIARQPVAWLMVALFLFHAANLPFLLAIADPGFHATSLWQPAYTAYQVLTFIVYSLYTIAFLCKIPPRT
jgi:hypothetical protein